MEWRLLYSDCPSFSNSHWSCWLTFLQFHSFPIGVLSLGWPFLGNSGGFYPMSGGSGQCSRFSYGDDQSVLLNPFFGERILENSIVCVSRQCCFRFCFRFLEATACKVWILSAKGISSFLIVALVVLWAFIGVKTS